MAKSEGKPTELRRGGAEGQFDEMPSPTGAQALRRVQGQHVTAIQVQVPRDIKKIEQNVLTEFELAGEDAYYTWEVNDKHSDTGKSWIEGTSIDGAMIMVRHYGNCAVETAPIEDGPKQWVISSTFLDLETGFTLNRLFRQRKSGGVGTMMADRSLDMDFQIGQSKSIRNVVLAVMPGWLKRKAMDAAKKGAEKDMKDPQIAIKQSLRAFELIRVSVEAIEWKLGKKIASFEKSDVVRTRGLYRAIFDGQTTVEAEFTEFWQQSAPAQTSQEPPAEPAKGEVKPTDAPAAAAAPPAPVPVSTPTTEVPKGEVPPAQPPAPPTKTPAREPGDDAD